ncbi:hypothetical protein LTR85_001925 [Meristemomyces frigidus]|nr:hypothetical protein LTR85_001925 [Meristemomyces frigidus]
MACDTLADKMEDAAGGSADMSLKQLKEFRRQHRDYFERRTRSVKVAKNEAQEAGVFDFFSLPRELRDQIYEEALQYKKKFQSQHGARIRGRRIAEVSLQLVSKQFRQEYLERAERETCLVIVDRDHYHGEILRLPTPIKYAKKLELHLALACDQPDHIVGRCRVLPEIRMHRKWIVDLCEQMKHLESVAINVMIDPHAMVKDCEQSLLNEQYRFSNLDTLASVDVYHCAYYVGAGNAVVNATAAGSAHAATTTGKSPSSSWNFTRQRKLIMNFSPETGNLQRLIEQAEVAEEVNT